MLWRTSPLRTTRPTPARRGPHGDERLRPDAVRGRAAASTACSTTALLGDAAGREPVAPRPSCASAAGSAATATATRSSPPRSPARPPRSPSEHVLLGLERAATRIGRTLTLDEADTPADARRSRRSPSSSSALDARRRPRASAPARPTRPTAACCSFVAARIAATRARRAPPRLRRPRRAARRPARRAGLAARGRARTAARTASCRTSSGRSRPSASTSPSSRCASTRRCTARPSRRSRAGRRARASMTVEVLDVFRTIADAAGSATASTPPRRYIVSFTQSSADLANVYELAELALGSAEAAPVLDVIPLFETFADLEASTRILDECSQPPQVQARLAATGPQARGHARLLRLVEGRRARLGDASPSTTRRRASPSGRDEQRHRAHAVPRPRRRAGPRRRTGQRGRAAPSRPGRSRAASSSPSRAR